MPRVRFHQNSYKSQCGVSAVEATLSALVLFSILVIGIDFLRVSFHIGTLQYASTEAARFASLGNYSSTQDIKAELDRRARMILNESDVAICRVSPTSQVCPGGTRDTLIPQNWFKIKVNYSLPATIQGFRIPISITSTAKYEPDLMNGAIIPP